MTAMTTTLQHKSIPVVCRMPKSRSLTGFLVAIGVRVEGEPKREDIKRAHRIFRGAKGQSVEINSLWNEIKRFICRVCGGVKLRQKSGTCSVICGMDSRAVSRRLLAVSLMLCVSAANAQRGVGSNPAATTKSRSPFALIIPPFKQQYFMWDYSPAGTSNTVSWGLQRNAWTNGSRTVTTNSFPYTNGWHYKVTALFDGIESTPALWPSNRIDRVWIQTSTNLVNWTDAYIWTTNFNKPQEYLRHRSELIEWK